MKKFNITGKALTDIRSNVFIRNNFPGRESCEYVNFNVDAEDTDHAAMVARDYISIVYGTEVSTHLFITEVK